MNKRCMEKLNPFPAKIVRFQILLWINLDICLLVGGTDFLRW